MYRFRTKHLGLLKIFNNSLSKKTVCRNDSFCYTLGITSMENVSSDCKFNFLLDPSCSRCSFPGKKFVSTRSEKLKELPQHSNKNEKKIISNYFIMPSADNHPSGTAENKEQIKQANVLKEDNLKVFEEIANGDNTVFETLKILQVRLEITSCQFGVKVQMEKQDWVDFLKSTPTKRKSYVAYSIVNTIRAIKKRVENSIKKYDLPVKAHVEEEEECMSSHFNDVRCYHLFHNAMFLKLRAFAMRRMYYAKGFTAMLYSPCLVFDCSYEHHMSSLELKELAKQLVASAAVNLRSEQPYHLVFCNFKKNNKCGQVLEKFNPIIYTDEYPITITEKSYLDLFPKRKLVYLTPHCKTTLKTFDPDKVYIIGAFIDKTCKKPISLGKAKEQNLSMARFPIDEFLDWGLGNKCLSLPHVAKIMVDLKTHKGNWHKAFEVIPKRCLEKHKEKSVHRHSFETEIMEIYKATDYSD